MPAIGALYGMTDRSHWRQLRAHAFAHHDGRPGLVRGGSRAGTCPRKSSPTSWAPRACKRAPTSLMLSTANMMQPIPSRFTGGLCSPAEFVGVELAQLQPAMTIGRAQHRDVTMHTIEAYGAIHGQPSTVVSPSNSRPSSTKNAIAVLRWSTTMPILSSRWTAMLQAYLPDERDAKSIELCDMRQPVETDMTLSARHSPALSHGSEGLLCQQLE